MKKDNLTICHACKQPTPKHLITMLRVSRCKKIPICLKCKHNKDQSKLDAIKAYHKPGGLYKLMNERNKK